MEKVFPSFIASVEALAALAGKVQLGAAPSSTKLLLTDGTFLFWGGFRVGGEYDVFVTYSFSLFMKLNHKRMLLL